MLTPEMAEARTKAPAACYADLPKRFPSPEAVMLCAGALSSSPAQCASAATSTLKDFGPSDVAALCRNAPPTTTTDGGGGGGSGKADPTGPVQCVKAAPSKLSGPEHAVALCAEASSSMPAKCVEELKGPSGKMTPEEKIALCKGARSTTPAKCAVSAPTTLDAGLRAKLCARTTSSKAPSTCFKETRNALRDELLQVEFCAGVVDDGPAKCVTAAPFNLENKLKVGLCRAARDDGPAECVKAIQSLRYGSSMGAPEEAAEAAKLCEGATGEAPAKCFEASPRDLGIPLRRQLCHGATSEAPATCAALGRNEASKAVQVGVCRGAKSTGPMDCATHAPFGSSDEDIALLCRDADPRAAACAKDVPFGFSTRERATLCARSVSDAPARCAIAAPEGLSKPEIVTLCAGARDVTAAYCAKQILTAGRAWNPALAKHCRAAESSAAGAAIGRTWWDGRERAEPLYPKTDVQVRLNVQDQFGQLRPWDNVTEMRASIDLARSHGATLDGFKHNTSVNGVVSFNYLRFSQPGAFDLRFSIGDKYVAMVRVVVEPTGDEGLGPTGRCGQVYYPHLTSFNRGTNESAGQPAASAGDEQVALLRWPQSVEALACVPVMEGAGFKISQGWGGDLWVWYRPAMEALETGEGLPQAYMDFYERLGVGWASNTHLSWRPTSPTNVTHSANATHPANVANVANVAFPANPANPTNPTNPTNPANANPPTPPTSPTPPTPPSPPTPGSSQCERAQDQKGLLPALAVVAPRPVGFVPALPAPCTGRVRARFGGLPTAH